MGLFRREKPIHEQLAEEAGLDIDGAEDELAVAANDSHLETRIPIPSDLVAVHGIPRDREWDAAASAEAPGLPGDSLEFVALADGTLIVDDDLPDGALTPLADALEPQISAPYHAYAFWQEDDVWSVAARRTEIVEVPEDVPGDEVELVLKDGSRSIVVDEQESDADVPSLEAFAAQHFDSFVMHASRLDDLLWEVTVMPL